MSQLIFFQFIITQSLLSFKAKLISSVLTLSLSLVSSPSLKCSASMSRAAASLASSATRPPRLTASLPSVRRKVAISRWTSRTVVSSTPVLWNSDTITRNRICSYLR